MTIIRLRLITYHNGNRFDPTKFDPIKNQQFIKPLGGLWSSPVESTFGWKEWCQGNEFRNDFSEYFEFDFEGNAYIIDNLQSAERMRWIAHYDSLRTPDYEKMVSMGYDAIWMTVAGERATRFSYPYSLYGWDCETVLIMNPEKVFM